jgi:hypothetical protein
MRAEDRDKQTARLKLSSGRLFAAIFRAHAPLVDTAVRSLGLLPHGSPWPPKVNPLFSVDLRVSV